MADKKPLVVINNKCNVPIHLVNLKKVQKKFTHLLYEESVCARCPYLEERPCYICDTCQAFSGEIRTYDKSEHKGIQYIGLPLGQKKNFLDYLYIDDWDKVRIKDCRYDTKFDYDITFGGVKNGVLRDYQEIMCEDFLKAKYGILNSPPRSGKTMAATYIGVKRGRRMLVVANQKEFLNQFEEHVRDYTNLPELEEKYDLKLYGKAKTYEEFAQYQIATATIQTFYSAAGQKLLKRICKFFGMVWLDECFTYGHRVMTNVGLVAIGDIVEGEIAAEFVLSHNHDTDTDEYKSIVSFTKKKTKQLCKVVVDSCEYICTPNHEFYVAEKGYVQAKDLIASNQVLSTINCAIVNAVTLFESGEVDVYDIGVEHNHNYYIYPPIGNTPILVHNCHTGAAKVISKTLSSMPIKVKWGATGTVERKDGKHKILEDILGPIVASSTVESMMPITSVIWTGLKPKRPYSQWTYAMKWLANNEDRNNMIIDSVLVDIERGHSIIIPSVFREHITYLTRRINAEYGSRIADYFMGGADKANLKRRATVLEEAKSGEIRVVVGTRSILQLGLNVPRWSLIKEIIPISNKPNLQQETSRIRTPMNGKLTPEIQFFVDDMKQSLWCFKSSIHHIQQFGYAIDPESIPIISRAFGKIGVKNWMVEKDGTKKKKAIKINKVERVNGKLF